jgi:hypothetical protein
MSTRPLTKKQQAAVARIMALSVVSRMRQSFNIGFVTGFGVGFIVGAVGAALAFYFGT